MQIVHMRFLQNGEHIVIGKRVNHRIFKRLYLVHRFRAGQELQTQDKGSLGRLDLDLIHHHIVEIAVSPFRCEAYLALPQNQKVILVIDPPQYLFRVTNSHFYLLCEVVKSFIHQTTKKRQRMKNALVTFLQVLFPHRYGQTLNERFLLLDVELFSYVDTLLDVVADPPLQVVRKGVFLAELFEGLEVFALLDVLGSDIADERADPVDVVGEAHDTDDFYEDQAESLLVVGGIEIAEPYG